ncbi:hypothetical protein BH10BAC3_BH10BAC3_10360 [soil metagenome]
MGKGFSLLLVITLFSSACFAIGEETRSTTVHSIKFFKKGNQLSLPVIPLNSIEQLELHFDDFQTSSKSYYYTYQLCDANWEPANLSQMDYIKGFSQNRITLYRFSSISFSRYVHYQINLPAANCMPSRSGNYLLKVFTNGDTTNLVFSRKMMVVQDKVTIGAQVLQPFSQNMFKTHQKIVTKVNFGPLDIFNPVQQIRIVVLQNNRWDNAQTATNPTFIRGKEYEYSSEDNFIFEGGKEFRWLDLRSLRLQSERVRRIDYKDKTYDVYPVPDSVRSPLRYVYYQDLNGRYTIETLEDINPWWQSDYATVHFTFLPNNHDDFSRRQLFLFGEMTGYDTSPANAMQWNEEKKAYEKDVLLKNGYYSYGYVTKDPGNQPVSFRFTEGTVWDTENQYSILVYYRPFGSRSDEIVGYTEINSLNFLNQR